MNLEPVTLNFGGTEHDGSAELRGQSTVAAAAVEIPGKVANPLPRQAARKPMTRKRLRAHAALPETSSSGAGATRGASLYSYDDEATTANGPAVSEPFGVEDWIDDGDCVCVPLGVVCVWCVCCVCKCG